MHSSTSCQILLVFWFTRQFLEFVNFMSWPSPLYRYKSLGPAHRFALRSYHIPKIRREPAGTITSGGRANRSDRENVEQDEMTAAF